MEPIPDPLKNQEPMETEPRDDQMLNELERSIENRAGFGDPLADHDGQFMDGLAKHLDELEASIEGTPQHGHGRPIVPDHGPMTPRDDGTVISDGISEEEVSESIQENSESTDEDSPAAHDDSQSDCERHELQFPLQQRFRGQLRLRGRRRDLFKRRTSVTTKNRITRGQGSKRFCPESHDVIHEQECKACEKYRHWPDGTDEEPRECWYDWQGKPPSDKFDDEGDDAGEEH